MVAGKNVDGQHGGDAIDVGALHGDDTQMRPRGSVGELDARRRMALRLLDQQLSLNEVARRVGCHASSVVRCRDWLHDVGEPGLKTQSRPGCAPRLSSTQKQQLVEELLSGPEESGYHTATWTTDRIAEVTAKRFGITYHRAHVGRLMHSFGWSHQKSGRHAVERSDAVVEGCEAPANNSDGIRLGAFRFSTVNRSLLAVRAGTTLPVSNNSWRQTPRHLRTLLTVVLDNCTTLRRTPIEGSRALRRGRVRQCRSKCGQPGEGPEAVVERQAGDPVG